MTWSAVVGKSPVLIPGNVVTIVRLTNSDTGKSSEHECRSDGSLAGLTAAVRALVANINPATDTAAVVAPGTVLDLKTPVVQPTDPATPEQMERLKFFVDLTAARQQAKVDALSPELQARCLPSYVPDL